MKKRKRNFLRDKVVIRRKCVSKISSSGGVVPLEMPLIVRPDA